MAENGVSYTGSFDPRDAVRTRMQLFGFPTKERAAFDWIIEKIREKHPRFDMNDAINEAMAMDLMYYGELGEIRIKEDADLSVLEGE